MTIPHTKITTAAADLGMPPAYLANALRAAGHDVEQPVDGVLRRAREIAAQYWASDDEPKTAARTRSGERDGMCEVRTARAAIEDGLAIVARVRERCERRYTTFDTGWRDCADAITAAMKGESK